MAADLLAAFALYAAIEAFAVWRLSARLVPGSLTAVHAYFRVLTLEREAAARKAAQPAPTPAPPVAPK